MPPYIPPSARNTRGKPWTRPFSNQSPGNSKDRDNSQTQSRHGPPSRKFQEATNSSSNQAHSNDSPRHKPFSRLRPAPIQQDPLEAAGLPSKGDTVLLDLKAQESYYGVLLSRYMDWCANAGVAGVTGLALSNRKVSGKLEDDLSQSFDGMSLDGSSFIEGKPSTTSATVKANSGEKANTKELSTLHMSMRKLREALLATSRTDAFAQQVYIFIVRASVLSQTFESYHPALLHLLHGIHATTPLSSSTLHEMVGYKILDTACRLGDYGEAFVLRSRWQFEDKNVDLLLSALVRDDWVSFWRARDLVDGYQRALIRWAEDGVRKHALKCVGRAYLSVGKEFVMKSAGGRSWEELVSADGVGWEEDGSVVVVRRIKPAPKTTVKQGGKD